MEGVRFDLPSLGHWYLHISLHPPWRLRSSFLPSLGRVGRANGRGGADLENASPRLGSNLPEGECCKCLIFSDLATARPPWEGRRRGRILRGGDLVKLVAAEFEWTPPRKRADAPFRPSRRRVNCNVSDLCRNQCLWEGRTFQRPGRGRVKPFSSLPLDSPHGEANTGCKRLENCTTSM